MDNIMLTIMFTAVLFILSGFALAFVYNNKRNDRCLMCGFKPEASCVKVRCSKIDNRN